MLTPLFVWQNKVLKRIDLRQVLCLFTEGNYTKIVVSDNNFYMVRSTLAGALKKLPPEMFIRIHRSIAVSVFYIDQVAKDHLIIHEESIPIGKQYYRSLIRRLNVIE
jgi:DNA-binding LytR/AlgR family response regulator